MEPERRSVIDGDGHRRERRHVRVDRDKFRIGTIRHRRAWGGESGLRHRVILRVKDKCDGITSIGAYRRGSECKRRIHTNHDLVVLCLSRDRGDERRDSSKGSGETHDEQGFVRKKVVEQESDLLADKE